MPAISTFGDLAKTSLNWLNKNRAVNMQAYTSFQLYKQFTREDTASEDGAGGPNYQKTLIMRDAGGFYMGALGEPVPVSRSDVTELAVMGWQYPEQASMFFDEREFPLNGDGTATAAKIVSQFDVQRDAARRSWVTNLENQLAGTWSNSADTKSISGLLYHASPVTKSSTDSSGGFNGQYLYDRSNTLIGSTWEGLDTTLPKNANARNWCATHNNTFDPQTRQQTATAMENTGFQMIPELTLDNGRVGRSMLLTNTRFFLEYERDANLGPDDRNGDLAQFNSKLKFRGVPLVKVQAWDSLDTTNSVIGVNTKNVYFVKQAGMWEQVGDPIRESGSNYHMWRYPYFGVGNLFVDNRRAGIFRIHAAF